MSEWTTLYTILSLLGQSCSTDLPGKNTMETCLFFFCELALCGKLVRQRPWWRWRPRGCWGWWGVCRPPPAWKLQKPKDTWKPLLTAQWGKRLRAHIFLAFVALFTLTGIDSAREKGSNGNQLSSSIRSEGISGTLWTLLISYLKARPDFDYVLQFGRASRGGELGRSVLKNSALPERVESKMSRKISVNMF